MRPGLVVASILALSLVVAGCASERSQPITCPETDDGTTRGPGGRIAWSTEGFGGPCIGIYTMSPDGTVIRLVTKIRPDPFYLPLAPAWSPDGRMIAFVGECGGEPVFDLCVMNADGTALRTVAAGPMALTPPAWSPDGTRLAFGRRAGTDSIHIVGLDGTGETRLVERGTEPAWSPDGTRIAFASDEEGTFKLYLVNPDGSGLVRISDGPHDSGPAWSPDGRRIAFASTRAGKPAFLSDVARQHPDLRPPHPPHDIYAMRADGTGVVNLTDDPSENIFPTWSPDGAHIAFSSVRDGDYELYVMDADGNNQTRLTALHGSDADASWTS